MWAATTADDIMQSCFVGPALAPSLEVLSMNVSMCEEHSIEYTGCWDCSHHAWHLRQSSWFQRHYWQFQACFWWWSVLADACCSLTCFLDCLMYGSVELSPGFVTIQCCSLTSSWNCSAGSCSFQFVGSLMPNDARLYLFRARLFAICLPVSWVRDSVLPVHFLKPHTNFFWKEIVLYFDYQGHSQSTRRQWRRRSQPSTSDSFALSSEYCSSFGFESWPWQLVASHGRQFFSNCFSLYF
jgi:hypothetical protein